MLVAFVHGRSSELHSFKLNDGKLNLGPVEITDEGFDVLVKAKGLQFTVSKAEAWKYAVPVVALAAVGISGAILLGTFIPFLLSVFNM